MYEAKGFVLASKSQRRIDLLNKIGIKPSFIQPSDINEEVRKKEKPKDYCKRIAIEKALDISKNFKGLFILSADTIVFCSNKIFLKPKDKVEARQFLEFFSGRKHSVLTSVCLFKDKIIAQKNVITKITFKKLTPEEIDEYIVTKEWIDKAGAYAIQGYAEKFIKFINGSYSNVVGLPLYETYNLLKSNKLI